MKALYYILVISIFLSSCGQVASKKATSIKEDQKSNVEVLKKDSVEEGVLRIMPPNNDTVIPIQNMQSEDMQLAVTSYNAGVEFYDRGDIDDAMSQFKTSLEYFPENSKAAHYLARIYFERGEKGLALSYYEDAVQYDPADSVSILGIGQVYFDMGAFDKAMEYYNNAVEAGPKYGLAYYNRGTLLGIQEKYIPALDDLNKSIELDPKNPNAYLNRGLAYFFLKQLDAACEDWHKASEMGLEKGKEAVDFYCK